MKLAGLLLWMAAVSLAEPPAVVIRAGKILDVRTGTYLTNGIIWVQGERIARIGPATGLPSGTHVVDLSNLTVLPGLIDCHTHLTVSRETLAAAAAAARSGSVPDVARAALLGARHARLTLEAGFTTVRNLGGPGYADLALRDAIQAGDVPGPRIVAAGRALTGTPKEELPATLALLQENIARGADVIKFFATGGVLLGNDTSAEVYTASEMRAIVDAAHAAGRKVACHAHGTTGIRDAVLAGADSIEHGSGITPEIVELMKQHGTYLVPTVDVFEALAAAAGDERVSAAKETIIPPGLPGDVPDALKRLASRRENLARAIRLGVKIAFGTDASGFHGLNAREFRAMTQLGVSPLAAIQSVTINAADLLGWSDRIGSLGPGMLADLIGVEGDPVGDVAILEHVRFVMKGGKIVSQK